MNYTGIELTKVLLISTTLNLVAPTTSNFCKAELSAIKVSNFVKCLTFSTMI